MSIADLVRSRFTTLKAATHETAAEKARVLIVQLAQLDPEHEATPAKADELTRQLEALGYDPETVAQNIDRYESRLHLAADLKNLGAVKADAVKMRQELTDAEIAEHQRHRAEVQRLGEVEAKVEQLEANAAMATVKRDSLHGTGAVSREAEKLTAEATSLRRQAAELRDRCSESGVRNGAPQYAPNIIDEPARFLLHERRRRQKSKDDGLPLGEHDRLIGKAEEQLKKLRAELKATETKAEKVERQRDKLTSSRLAPEQFKLIEPTPNPYALTTDEQLDSLLGPDWQPMEQGQA